MSARVATPTKTKQPEAQARCPLCGFTTGWVPYAQRNTLRRTCPNAQCRGHELTVFGRNLEAGA